MSLRWDFNEDKMGYIQFEGDKRINIYNGNAYAIFLYESEDQYWLQNFYADKEHAKRCLGLTKETKGTHCFNDDISFGPKTYKMEKVVLDPRARNARDLAMLLLKAYDNITIELKTE